MPLGGPVLLPPPLTRVKFRALPELNQGHGNSGDRLSMAARKAGLDAGVGPTMVNKIINPMTILDSMLCMNFLPGFLSHRVSNDGAYDRNLIECELGDHFELCEKSSSEP